MTVKAQDLLTYSRWRHVKRGTFYLVLHVGELQASAGPLVAGEGTTMVVYRGIDDGKIWIRPVAEFCDGRFIGMG